MTARKPRIGRPPLGKTTVRINLKLSLADREKWDRAAKKEGLTLSEWLRSAVDSGTRRATPAGIETATAEKIAAWLEECGFDALMIADIRAGKWRT